MKNKYKITKKDKVTNYLINNGTITTYEAFSKFNATRLSAIIFDLRKEGWQIETTQVCNDECCYARYFIHADKNKKMIEQFTKAYKDKKHKAHKFMFGVRS